MYMHDFIHIYMNIFYMYAYIHIFIHLRSHSTHSYIYIYIYKHLQYICPKLEYRYVPANHCRNKDML